jgi:uncharacterized membrane protein
VISSGSEVLAMRTARDAWRTAAWLFVLVGLAWRLPGLGTRCLWFDESFSWQLTRFSWHEMVVRAQQDVHPLLYYVGLKLWTAVLGDSVFAMRLLSVAWFVVALVGAVLLCNELVAMKDDKGRADENRDGGVIAAMLLVSSPLLYYYSRETRMYTQEIALVMLSSWLLLRALREKARPLRWWAAYGASAAMVGHTHNFGLLSVAAQWVFTAPVVVAAVVRQGGAPWHVPELRGAVLGTMIAAALYLPWLPTLLHQQAQVALDYWAKDVETNSPLGLNLWRQAFLSWVLHNRAHLAHTFEENEATSALSYALLAFVGFILLRLAWLRSRAGWFLVAGMVVPVSLAVIISIKTNRNLMAYRFLIPSFALLLIGLALLIGRIRPRAIRWSIAVFLVTNLSYFTLQFERSVDATSKTGFSGACDAIADEWREGDVVVTGDPIEFFPTKYHARNRFPVQQANYSGLVITHYTGGPIFQAEDLTVWPPDPRHEPRRVWIVRREADAANLAAPVLWFAERSSRFGEPIRFRGDVIVECWNTSLTPAPTSKAGPNQQQ